MATFADAREADPMHQDRINLVLAPSLFVAGFDEPRVELDARVSRVTASVLHFET
jgi:hypothetical protein